MPDVISSRTPEGLPANCPVCRRKLWLLFSPAGDATCPHCGTLIWRSQVVFHPLREKIAEILGVDQDLITADTTFVNELGADSLAQVELVMELEEEFALDIPEDAAEKIQSLGDLIRYLQEQERKKRDGLD